MSSQFAFSEQLLSAGRDQQLLPNNCLKRKLEAVGTNGFTPAAGHEMLFQEHECSVTSNSEVGQFYFEKFDFLNGLWFTNVVYQLTVFEFDLRLVRRSIEVMIDFKFNNPKILSSLIEFYWLERPNKKDPFIFPFLLQKRQRFSDHSTHVNIDANRQGMCTNGDGLNYFSTVNNGDICPTLSHNKNNVGADSLLQSNLECHTSNGGEEFAEMDFECETVNTSDCPPNSNEELESSPAEGSPAREFLLK